MKCHVNFFISDNQWCKNNLSGLSLSTYLSQTIFEKIYFSRKDFNLTRRQRQIDRTDALLGGFSSGDKLEHPLQQPTGEKTRKTYDFTKTYHVGLSCHDIQASQGRLDVVQ